VVIRFRAESVSLREYWSLPGLATECVGYFRVVRTRSTGTVLLRRRPDEAWIPAGGVKEEFAFLLPALTPLVKYLIIEDVQFYFNRIISTY
jgi:hypothetical protein